MDDITSCLSLLKEYITSWSHDLVKKGSKLIEENKELKVTVVVVVVVVAAADIVFVIMVCPIGQASGFGAAAAGHYARK